MKHHALVPFAVLACCLVMVTLSSSASAEITLTAEPAAIVAPDGAWTVTSATEFTLTATEPAGTPEVIYHIALSLYGPSLNVSCLGGGAWKTGGYQNAKQAVLKFKLDTLQDGTPIRDGVYHFVYQYFVYLQDGKPERRGQTTLKVQLVTPVVASPKASRPAGLSAALAYNLVENPGLEQPAPGAGDRPAGFESRTAGNGVPAAFKFLWESPGFNSGKCISVEALDVYLGYWQTVVPVKPATDYAVSFRYKCASVSPAAYEGNNAEFRKGRPGGPNLELGDVSRPAPDAKTPAWSDTVVAVGQRGGTYLPVVTDWASWRQVVKTGPAQTQMSVKLRMFCSIQKAWFDDVSVVELGALPKISLVAPAAGAVADGKTPALSWTGPAEAQTYVVECSTSPLYVADRTQRLQSKAASLTVKDPLGNGRWFWRVGVPDQNGLPVWVAESDFHVGKPSLVPADTTPPIVNLPQPVPNASAAPDASVSATFTDAGSGIDTASVRIMLDGKDATPQTKIGAAGFTLKPAQPLTAGAHRVEVRVADKAGNQGNLLSWRFGVGETLRYDMQLNGRKVLLNGEPYFPIGIWNYACHPGDGRFREDHLAAAGAAGVDVILNTIPPGLDVIHKNGMKSCQNLTGDLQEIVKGEISEAAAEAVLLATGDPNRGQAQFRNHPATLAYWGDDPENIENTNPDAIPPKTLATLTAARSVLKKRDPGHPMIFAIANLPRLKEGGPFADVLLNYRYPVPQYHPQVINPFTIGYVMGVFPNKPFFFNSQALDLTTSDPQYADPAGMRPTVPEMRAMVYYSAILGISGYTFYANYLNAQDTPEHWAALLKTASELRYIAPYLAAANDVQSAKLRQDSSYGSVYCRELEREGSRVLVAVNMSGGPVTAAWQFEKPVRASVLFEDRATPGPVKELEDSFAAFETHIYSWR